MEKIIYILWRNPGTELETFAGYLRTRLAWQLQETGVRGLQVNVADAAVAPASSA